MDAWNGMVMVDNKEYKIVWWHNRMDQDRHDVEVVQPTTRAYTECAIADAPFLKTRGYGMAHCSWSDNFSRKTGRKLSLQRALLASDFTEHQRRQVWWQVLAIKGLVV